MVSCGYGGRGRARGYGGKLEERVGEGVGEWVVFFLGDLFLFDFL